MFKVHNKIFDFIYHCNRRAIQTDIMKCVISQYRSETHNLVLRGVMTLRRLALMFASNCVANYSKVLEVTRLPVAAWCSG